MNFRLSGYLYPLECASLYRFDPNLHMKPKKKKIAREQKNEPEMKCDGRPRTITMLKSTQTDIQKTYICKIVASKIQLQIMFASNCCWCFCISVRVVCFLFTKYCLSSECREASAQTKNNFHIDFRGREGNNHNNNNKSYIIFVLYLCAGMSLSSVNKIGPTIILVYWRWWRWHRPCHFAFEKTF